MSVIAVVIIFAWQARTANVETFDGNWELVDATQLSKTTVKPTIAVEDSRVTGSTGCNNFSFDIKRHQGSTVEIANFSMTRILCAEAEGLELYLVTQFQKTQLIEKKDTLLCFLSGTRNVLLAWSRAPTSDAQTTSRVRCDSTGR
ncbi:META domain-containing protein [Bradyrhizobium sp. BWA-3-5]|uniref:META domain-containing protein n=1 Tax=Bradyrhizobium sp. BWA-3-5 TaxID=3080013 RepID=UPI00293E4DBB|nr:META domain-containing protein [Bradyrhizobium sp. BWA-3-5]WOH63669.1 META domain-containing protein [Bradyrhizobium sp. BWA-3-5]